MYCSRTVHGSHDTIHTFKNYFAIVFSVFSFSKNKFNPNRPLMSMLSKSSTNKYMIMVKTVIDKITKNMIKLFKKKKNSL